MEAKAIRSNRVRFLSPYAMLAVVCTGVFVAALDQTMVITALPGIMADIRLPLSKLDQASWIITGYLLGYTVAMPLMGRISDVYGHVRVYALSMVLFMGGSALAALAGSLGWLVAARLVQAVGGGAVVPVAMALVGDAFPSLRRALPLGIIGGVAEAGGVLGPLYGGAITQAWGWQWIFWINLPIGAGVILLLSLLMTARPGRRARIDYPGGLLLGGSLVSLTLALSREAGQARPLYFTAPLFLIAALFFLLFLLRESRAASPLIRLSMFRSPTLAGANATNFLVGAALILALVNIPLMADTVLGQRPLEGGLRLMRLTAAMAAGAPLGGLLCQRFGYRAPVLMGLALSAAGFYLMRGWGLDIADPTMSLHLVLGGLGFGLVIAPVATAVVNSVGEDEKAVAASLVTVMRMMGMMVGLSALSAWGMGRFHTLAGGIPLSALISNDPEARDQLIRAGLSLFQEFFLASMAICLLALLPALLLRRR